VIFNYDKENHEIRFKCESDLVQLSKKIREEIAGDLILSAFYKKVYLLGINEIQDQILKKNPNILLRLVKGGKK
jgi:hypothetical protein